MPVSGKKRLVPYPNIDVHILKTTIFKESIFKGKICYNLLTLCGVRENSTPKSFIFTSSDVVIYANFA